MTKLATSRSSREESLSLPRWDWSARGKSLQRPLRLLLLLDAHLLHHRFEHQFHR
jgi:hypothetical protein